MYKYLPALRFNYPVTIRIAGLAGVLLITFGFLFTPRNFDVFILDEANQIIIEQIDIPQTQQLDLPPPPARPSVPIESEDEDLEDVTIEETDLESFEAWDAPPPPPEGPRVKFIPYDDHPEIAQEAGIEGTVIVQVFVDKKGRVKETIILKGIPNTGLDEAAIKAIRKTRFFPAKQRERAVGVWISIPVNFRLK